MSDDVADQVGSLMRTLRTIEQRHSTVRKKLRLTDQSLLESKKSMKADVSALSKEVSNLRHTMESISYKMSIVSKQLEDFAPAEDVAVLAKYLELWQPLNFVTRQELKKHLSVK